MARGTPRPIRANRSAPITGCQNSRTGRRRYPRSTNERPRTITTASSPQATPSTAYSGSLSRPANEWAGTENSGPAPNSATCMPAAMLEATTRGMNARVVNSNSSSSMASTTEARGAPNVAAIPAAAPLASRIFRSAGETDSTWPISEPSAPPVTMIGPSAPNGPPVPMAMAADRGLAIAVRGWMRLCLVRMASIASGMPCPRITGDHMASTDTISPPAIAAMTSVGPKTTPRKLGTVQAARWNRARLVISPIRWSRT